MTDFDGGLIIQVYDFHTGQEKVSSVWGRMIIHEIIHGQIL